ncbi:MAG TPA: T9SS type A sorting domain-containing protein [Bacteroidales bacterium]|nr:T9SS type A sorting domain-containing protein [Bacteroidales bacterium]HOR60794.1 T9SS type A sorting domain-containing protein [Bacteroidales bacterium]
MKKFTLVFAILLIGSFSFAQRQVIKLPVEKQILNDSKDAWFGNSSVAALDLLDPNYEYAIRIKSGQIAAGSEITKVKFYSDHQNYAQYGATSNSYQIKFYTGSTFDEELGIAELSAAGTLAYTQNHTATTTGFQEVTLTTPFIVPSGECWVSIKNTGTTLAAMFMAAANPASANQYVMMYNYQGEDVWVANEYCVDETCTETEFNPFTIAVFYTDGQAYEENSDLIALFINSMTPPYSPVTEVNLTEGQGLTLNPAIQNDGPDDANDDVEISLTIDGAEFYGDTIPNFGLEAGFFTFLSEEPITISSEEMDALGLGANFNVCLIVTYAGIDPNPANNTACVAVTRVVSNLNENIAKAISVYPNPANNVLNVANAENANIVIVNMLGEVVANVNNASSNQNIDISKLANGTYFVKVDGEVFKINVVK